MSQINFQTFNEEINPKDKLVYVPLKNKSLINGGRPQSFKSMKSIMSKDHDTQIGLLIPKGLVVINIDNQKDADLILKIIKDRNEKVMAVKTPKGLHVYATSGVRYNTVHNVLTLGVKAGTISEDLGKSYTILPFKPKGNTDARLAQMGVLHYNTIGPLPSWLTPIYSNDSRTAKPLFNHPIQDAELADALYNALTYSKFTKLTASKRAEVIFIINKYAALHPLTQVELDEKILADHNHDTLPADMFFNKEGKFMHWVLGDYLIDYTHAVRNAIDKQLYFYNERKQVYESDPDFLKGIITNLIPTLTDNRKNEVVKHMMSKLSLNPVLMDQDPYLINFTNGVLDLETLELFPHSPDYFGTIQLNVAYNPQAKSNTADNFFSTIAIGNKEIIQLLYEAIGYSFLKTIELAKVFIMTGDGRNGKSTLLDLIREIVGLQNATTLDFKELSKDFGTGGLAGKLVSLAGDISDQRIDDSDVFKKIASGDLVRVNQKYKQQYDIIPYTTLWFSANKIPPSNDKTYAFYRRLCIIPLDANLSSVTKRDGMIFHKKLLADESREYVAHKAVLAIHNVLTNTFDFKEPQVVIDELESYRVSNSSTLQWCQHRKVKEIFNENPYDLYSRYTSWCDLNNRKPYGFDNFVKELESNFKLKYDDDLGRFPGKT